MSNVSDNAGASTVAFERVPPQDLAAEQAVPDGLLPSSTGGHPTCAAVVVPIRRSLALCSWSEYPGDRGSHGGGDDVHRDRSTCGLRRVRRLIRPHPP